MPDQPSDLSQFLAFAIDKAEYCVPIMTMREINGWSPATRLPNTPAYMRGVINLRGNIVPIFDLRARFTGTLTDAQHEYVRRSRTAAEHLLSLINDILDLAKIEAGKMPVYVENVSMPELIREVAQQVEPMAKAKHLTFTTSVSPDCPGVDTDKIKIKQILLNLLSNAVKFTNRGSVHLSVEWDDDSVQLSVSDSGVGIKPDEIDLIWEDFRQLDQSRTRSYPGTGLGLSITRRLTQQLGAEIAVNSVFGQGTTFSVRLPRVVHAAETGSKATV